MATKKEKKIKELADVALELPVLPTQELPDETLFSGLPRETLTALTPAKLRMILMFLTGQYTQAKIADIIGVSALTIRIWMQDPNVQAVIEELQLREFRIIDSSLKRLRSKAVNTVDSLLDSPMDQVRFAAAKDVLDRTGHKAVNELKIDKTVTTIEKQLAELAEYTINEAEVIDISDVVEQVKGAYGN